MTPDFLVPLIAGVAALLTAVFASTELVRKAVFRILGKPEPKKTYTERLSDLTSSLTKASAEVDSILVELSRVAKEKEASVRELEEALSTQEQREKELKERIEVLGKVSIPVAEHFAKLVVTGEQRSAKRDYILFGTGVIVTTFITIIIQVFSG